MGMILLSHPLFYVVILGKSVGLGCEEPKSSWQGLTSASLRLSHPLDAGALPKFESGNATYFLLYIGARTQAFAPIYNKKSLANARLSNFGWKMGFEPTTFGTTIRHSNRLSYIHHIIRFRIGDKSNTDFYYIQIF